MQLTAMSDLHNAAAADGLAVVVDGSVAASCVSVEGFGSDLTLAADLSLVVVDVVAATARATTVGLAAQLSTAADVIVPVVHHAVAAAMRAVPAVRTK